MAKKIKKRAKKNAAPEVFENVLPQNILPMGERVEENKNIYISQSVYKEIRKFTKNKTTNESGGMLVGSIIEEFGKTNIIIDGFVEAKYCEATPTTLKFTHETWTYVHKEIDKKHSKKKILGWIHTHPDFGIFLSEYDKFIHQNFFNEEHQVAYVVDPIQNIEGFYFWINGNIEKCRGFYIYDKTDKPISIDIAKEEEAEQNASRFCAKNILTGILSVVVVLLIFSNISTNNKLREIEYQQMTLADSANRALAAMQQTIWQQQAKIQELNDALVAAGIIAEPEVVLDSGTTSEENGQTEATEPEETAEETIAETTVETVAETTEETAGTEPAVSAEEGDTNNE